MSALYEIDLTTIDGQTQKLGAYAGKALLVVNVASRCGFTPQYQGLEALWRRYRERGFAVLAFPCDQFGHREPGDEAEIKSFCTGTYDVGFPLFAKAEVDGEGAERQAGGSRRGGRGAAGLSGRDARLAVDGSPRFSTSAGFTVRIRPS